MANEKVLLVDDEEQFTTLLAERMEARGLTVHTAASGAEALKRVETGESYDAVILDVSMPGMDGIETLKRMLAVNPDLQIILLTGNATMQQGIEAVKLGAREVLEKPADLSGLMAKISAAGTDRVVLAEKRLGKQIADIIGTKGW